MWYMLAETAQTGDHRNIILWVILAVVALVLIIASSVMAGISKKKDGKQDRSDRRDD